MSELAKQNSWTYYASITTINGVAVSVQETKNRKIKFKICTVMFVLMVIIAAGWSGKAFWQYMQHPIDTTVTVKTTDEIRQFPSITICHSNIVRKSAIHQTPLLIQILQLYFPGMMSHKTFLDKVYIS